MGRKRSPEDITEKPDVTRVNEDHAMTAFTTKLAAFALAAAAIAANPLLSTDAAAKPMGGGFGGGGMKLGGGFKPVGPIAKGPIFKGPIKIATPLKPLKPIKPFPPIKVGPIKPFPPIKPLPPVKPPHHHGHGAFWVLGGVTILATAYEGCGYEYYKWKSTDSSYWLHKYRECRGWE